MEITPGSMHVLVQESLSGIWPETPEVLHAASAALADAAGTFDEFARTFGEAPMFGGATAAQGALEARSGAATLTTLADDAAARIAARGNFDIMLHFKPEQKDSLRGIANLMRQLEL